MNNIEFSFIWIITIDRKELHIALVLVTDYQQKKLLYEPKIYGSGLGCRMEMC